MKGKPDYLEPSLPLPERVADLLGRLTLEEKIGMMASRQEAVPRLGIGEYHIGGEAAHGLMTKDGPATVFPQTIGLACSWDEALLEEAGSVVGDEARAYYDKRKRLGGLTLWAPTVDVGRDPRWGRTEECYGEDPFLAGKLAGAYARGMRGRHPFYIKAAATPKHFYANNNEAGRATCSASIEPRDRREFYLKAFEIACREGPVHSLMTSYNAINGIPAMLHPDLEGLVRGEWAMDGFIVSDGGALSLLVEERGYCPDLETAAAMAVKAGIDNLSDETDKVKQALRGAIQRGLLSEKDLDRALGRVLSVRFRLGQFDPDERNPYAVTGESVRVNRDHRGTALEAARKSIVLLRNGPVDGKSILPLDADAGLSVAVIGPLADVSYRDWYTGIAPYRLTPLQALAARLPAERLRYADGCDVTAFRTGDGRWVSTKSWYDGSLAANRPEERGGEPFRRTDWGWGNQTFRSLVNGSYMTTDDAKLSASADEVWGWKVKERFALDPVPGDGKAFVIRTWKGAAVGLDEAGNLVVIGEGADAIGRRPEALCLEILHDGLADAVAAARSADAAIVFVGNHPLLNGKEEIDRPDIVLPPAQDALVRAVLDANPRTVVVIVGSYPYALGDWAERAAAILYAPHGGQAAGEAIADAVFGVSNPAGRLPMTWHRSAAELPDILDYDVMRGGRTYRFFRGDPLYPFGFGLSYSSFLYRSINSDISSLGMRDEARVSVDVRNPSGREGEEVVQLYASYPASAFTRPARQLVGFKRVRIGSGETARVEIPVSGRELAVWEPRIGAWFMEAGECLIHASSSSADARLQLRLRMDGAERPARDPWSWTNADSFDERSGIRLGMGPGTLSSVACAAPASASGKLRYEAMRFEDDVDATLEALIMTGKDGGELSLRIGETQLESLHLGRKNEGEWFSVFFRVSPKKGLSDFNIEISKDIALASFRCVKGGVEKA